MITFSRLSPDARLHLALTVLVLIVPLSPSFAHAAGTGGTMPWDTNLTKISGSFTGPFAYAIALIGCVAAGATLIFAQELPWFLKAVCFVVLAGSFMCGANAFATSMNWTGAIV